jgi:two-component system chemotaxis sensor kinase CheA
MENNQDFLKKILATFKAEAEENLNAMAIHLIELEKNPPKPRQEELNEIIYRVAHSLKGASRSVNLNEIESICHAFEDVMSAIRDEEITYNTQVFDALHQTIDIITELLEYDNDDIGDELQEKVSEHIDMLLMVESGIEVEGTGKSRNRKSSEAKPIIEEIEDVKEPEAEPETEKVLEQEQDLDVPQLKVETPIPQEPEKHVVSKKTVAKSKARRDNASFNKSAADETIRISTQKLDNVLSQAEEMLSLKLRAIQRTKNLKNTISKFSAWHKESFAVLQTAQAVKLMLQKKGNLDGLSADQTQVAELSQYLEWTNSFVKDIEKELNDLREFSIQEIHTISSRIESLLDYVKELIAVPFSTLSMVFPKMIRDIAKDLDKQVDFSIEGDDIRIDRRILEKIRTPLLHILRNSIDYGIELPEERAKKGKSTVGKVSLKIKRLENSKISVVVSDDGAGINKEKLKQLYISDNNISELNAKNVTEKEYLNYIFQSGVSTSDIVTDLSGRGLGLAIAWQEVQQIGGSIEVQTEANKFTRFNIQLPLSIVTFRGVLIEVSGYEFVIPTVLVERVLRTEKEAIKTVEGKATILFQDEVVPLIKLSEILQLNEKQDKSPFIHVAIFEDNTRKIGFVIDRVINEQEVLVKNFNKQLKRVRNISGATILGSGKVVPILNISDLFKSSAKVTSTLTASYDNVSDEDKVTNILVVDDSITSRTLLKNILEAAGYNVTTAIDGLEGFTKLKEGAFAVVISDVEMPRLDGFGLTSKIRADKAVSDIPVILVTSLSKREHREKGIDVGANAYIVKSNFDQSNLLDILERLI